MNHQATGFGDSRDRQANLENRKPLWYGCDPHDIVDKEKGGAQSINFLRLNHGGCDNGYNYPALAHVRLQKARAFPHGRENKSR